MARLTTPTVTGPIEPDRFYRLPSVLAYLGIGKSAWEYGVKMGYYPKSHHFSPRCTVWRGSDLLDLIKRVEGGEIPGSDGRIRRLRGRKGDNHA